jgi:6,7-dimethyl-8-ribityllumazine synthase
MPVRKIVPNTRAAQMRVGVVVARFNPEIGEILLAGALRALDEAGVAEDAITVASVPGALEVPLALQRMAQTGDYDALVALGAVIRGETYHFEIVANESAAGVASVQLEFGTPIGNGILTTDSTQAWRAPTVGPMPRWQLSKWPTG